jgi:hypothetical protein
MISFRHATVLACTGADPVYDATVIVEGAVIKDVLTSARSVAGVGGEVIDCGGRTVMPGLIDAHVRCPTRTRARYRRRPWPSRSMATLGFHGGSGQAEPVLGRARSRALSRLSAMPWA